MKYSLNYSEKLILNSFRLSDEQAQVRSASVDSTLEAPGYNEQEIGRSARPLKGLLTIVEKHPSNLIDKTILFVCKLSEYNPLRMRRTRLKLYES